MQFRDNQIWRWLAVIVSALNYVETVKRGPEYFLLRITAGYNMDDDQIPFRIVLRKQFILVLLNKKKSMPISLHPIVELLIEFQELMLGKIFLGPVATQRREYGAVISLAFQGIDASFNLRCRQSWLIKVAKIFGNICEFRKILPGAMYCAAAINAFYYCFLAICTKHKMIIIHNRYFLRF